MMSKQASGFSKLLKDFDEEDFKKWWSAYPTFTKAGTNYLLMYVRMKDEGTWKDGRLTREVMNDDDS